MDKVLSVTSWKNIARPRISSTLMPYGFPLTTRITKYFNNLSCLPILNKDLLHNHNHISPLKSPSTSTSTSSTKHTPHITAVMVFARPNVPYKDPSVSSAIADHEWCYNVQGLPGGQHISNFSPIDGVLYALHQSLCDGILIGEKTLCHHAHSAFMPYESSQYGHVHAFEPDLGDILVQQHRLLQDYGYVDREFPAVFVVSQSGQMTVDAYNGETCDILNCEVFKHVNPFTGRVNDVHIITSSNGAAEIAKRWHKYEHLKARQMEEVVIAVSSEEEPALIEMQRIGEILYDEPYSIKYLSVEGGVQLIESLAAHKLVHQMNFTLMRHSVLERLRLEETEKEQFDVNRFECAQIKYRAAVGFDYVDHDCCFTIFDPFQSP